jgi:hypothetical protein
MNYRAVLLTILFAAIGFLPGCNGCPATQNPGTNINPPNMNWIIQDQTSGQSIYGQGPVSSTSITNVGISDTLVIGVAAQSPDGVTEMKVSGGGHYVCIVSTTTPGSYGVIGSGSLNVPAQDVHPSPPQAAYYLAVSVTMPCGGFKTAPPGSTVTVGSLPSAGQSYLNFTASATNTSGHTVNGTLQLGLQ